MDEELRIFQESVIRFLEDRAPSARVQKWRENGQVEREFWREAAEAGLLGVSIPEQYGGAGGNFGHDYVLIDLVTRKDISGFSVSLHNGIVMPYVNLHGSDEQKVRWLPRLTNGELVGAIAMSEPNAGSDLASLQTRAEDRGDHYLINGQKVWKIGRAHV